MRTVQVELPAGPARSYAVVVGVELPGGVTGELQALGSASRWAVVSDVTVAPIYAEPLVRELAGRGESVSSFVVPSGEEAKRRATVADLQDRLIESGCDRDTWIVAVGGGVVGDVAGYVAATLFRGVPYLQVPTTLLAMVDSSVGGKTGVDTRLGKNLIGAVHQPRRVLIDVAALETLPQEEMAAGLSEVIKYGVILDAELFQELEQGLLQACIERLFPFLQSFVKRVAARIQFLKSITHVNIGLKCIIPENMHTSGSPVRIQVLALVQVQRDQVLGTKVFIVVREVRVLAATDAATKGCCSFFGVEKRNNRDLLCAGLGGQETNDGDNIAP